MENSKLDKKKYIEFTAAEFQDIWIKVPREPAEGYIYVQDIGFTFTNVKIIGDIEIYGADVLSVIEFNNCILDNLAIIYGSETKDIILNDSFIRNITVNKASINNLKISEILFQS
jgi:hypothetical protein